MNHKQNHIKNINVCFDSKYSVKRYTTEGIYENNTQYTLNFDDIHIGVTHNQLTNLNSDILKFLKVLEDTYQVDANIFHNTYLIVDGIFVLRLRNKPLLDELQKLDDELTDERITVEQQRIIKLGLVLPENFWIYPIRARIVNNIYSLTYKPKVSNEFDSDHYIPVILISTLVLAVLFHVAKVKS